MVKKKLSKFEKTQFYKIIGKSFKMRDFSIKYRNELLNNETPAETIFKGYLVRMRKKFEFQRIIFAGRSFYIVDFYLPKWNIAIEIDGNHHTYDADIVHNDLRRTKDLKRVGVKDVIRFTNEEVFKYDSCIKKLKEILK